MKRFVLRSGDTTVNIPADEMAETEYGVVIAKKDGAAVAFVKEEYADFIYLSDAADR